MARTLPQWTRRLGKRRVDPFTRASRDGLDLLAAPGYDMSESIRSTLDAEVRDRVQGLLPGAVDAYSRDALDEWVDARARQFVARLDSEREERQAVWEALIGLAKEEAVRRKSRYDVDLGDVLRAQHALDVAREALTRYRGIGPLSKLPAPPDRDAISSTLGKIDIEPDWITDQHTTARAGGQPGQVRTLHLVPTDADAPVGTASIVDTRAATTDASTAPPTARPPVEDDDDDRR